MSVLYAMFIETFSFHAYPVANQCESFLPSIGCLASFRRSVEARKVMHTSSSVVREAFILYPARWIVSNDSMEWGTTFSVCRIRPWHLIGLDHACRLLSLQNWVSGTKIMLFLPVETFTSPSEMDAQEIQCPTCKLLLENIEYTRWQTIIIFNLHIIGIFGNIAR